MYLLLFFLCPYFFLHRLVNVPKASQYLEELPC